MVKITGLDALTRRLEEIQKAAAALDGDITNVNFDPGDPASIDRAIQHMSDAIDERVADYLHNDTVAEMVESLKEQYREAILEKAAAARATGDEK